MYYFHRLLLFQYVPTKGDSILGIITKTGSESFRVDIGSSMPAVLGNLSFEGATKRNKPDLKVRGLMVFVILRLLILKIYLFYWMDTRQIGFYRFRKRISDLYFR